MAVHVFVVLSLYRPQAEYLRAQIASVLAQDYRDLTVLVVPDGPEAGDIPETSDDRIRIVPQRDRKGVAGNFLRGLSEALSLSDSTSDLIAFCDQDDVWFPHKLSTLIEALRKQNAQMAHSDARVIAADGSLIAHSLFRTEKRQPHRDLADLLVVNDVSGMAMLFTRDCAKRATCQPPPANVLHDWWVALNARASGTTIFVAEPLVDYRRHTGNVVGPAIDRASKRPFLSRTYRDMCANELALRKAVWQKLREQAPSLPEFGELTSLEMLGRRLIPFGSQRSRAAFRLILGRLFTTHHA